MCMPRFRQHHLPPPVYQCRTRASARPARHPSTATLCLLGKQREPCCVCFDKGKEERRCCFVIATPFQVVVNATGPFVDEVREMSNPGVSKLVTPSSGVHVVLPDYYSAKTHGLIVPRTKDGRVLFILPWMQHTIAGTTDAETKLTMRPQATEEEINFILEEMQRLLTIEVAS